MALLGLSVQSVNAFAVCHPSSPIDFFNTSLMLTNALISWPACGGGVLYLGFKVKFMIAHHHQAYVSFCCYTINQSLTAAAVSGGSIRDLQHQTNSAHFRLSKQSGPLFLSSPSLNDTRCVKLTFITICIIICIILFALFVCYTLFHNKKAIFQNFQFWTKHFGEFSI